MDKFKRKMAILLVALVLISGLAACGNNNSETSSSNVSNTESSAAENSNASTATTADTNTTTAASTATTTADANTTTAEATSGSKKSEEEKKRHYIDDMELFRTDGTSVKLSSLAKENTILVFWATWCHFCVKEIPILEELAKEHDNLSIVMINSGESKDTVAEFVKKNNITLEVFYDEKSVISQKFGISGYPTNVFLSEELELIAYVSGKLEKDEFEDAFTKIKEFRTNRGDFNQ